VQRARFRPRRSLSTGVIVALVLLIGFRVWQLSSEQSPETLDANDYRVESVADGDTFRLTNGALVRLIGIDAPETKFSPRSGGDDQPLAQDAKAFVERGLSRGKVRLEFDKERVDKYGRFLAYVWYFDRDREEELLLNEELLRAGLARARLGYSYSDRMKRRFRAAELEARDARRGIWALREGDAQSRSGAERSWRQGRNSVSLLHVAILTTRHLPRNCAARRTVAWSESPVASRVGAVSPWAPRNTRIDAKRKGIIDVWGSANG
jgi:micrococcal nuclease